jgi:sulfur-oxidizing protein SoxY
MSENQPPNAKPLDLRGLNPMQRTLSHAAQGITLTLAAIVMALAFGLPAAAADAPWASIRKEFYGDRQIIDTKAPLILDAPDKAEDAALVPISIYLLPEIADNIKTLRVFIDNNPMPMVGTFTFGKAAGFGPKTISTRVRFDTLSDIRAIAETDDGKLYMATHFVQASGGCSSPAMKDAQEALDSAGQMHVKKLNDPHKFASSKNASSVTGEAMVMLRHPNYSGMQMDPASGQFIPAKYVRTIDIMRGEELVFHLEAGISMSSNPNVRFTYGTNGDEPLSAVASDSDGAVFKASSPPGNT